MYLPPYNYFLAYFSGCIVGQALLEGKFGKVGFIRRNGAFLSVLSTTIVMVWPFLTYPLARADSVLFTEYPLLIALAYTSYNCLWSLATAYILFRCAVQPSWVLARFLSAPIFQPLSRLSFSLYLVHYLVIWSSVLRTHSVLRFEGTDEFVSVICFFICYLFVNAEYIYFKLFFLHFYTKSKLLSWIILQSLVLSYLFYVVFEVPSVNLLKLLSSTVLRSGSSDCKIDEKKIINNKYKNN